MSSFNAFQREAFEIIRNGHNLLLLGAAGTGKTHFIKNIVKTLQEENKNVSVTASTGIACCLYNNAQTIHRWSGIGDGRYGKDEIQNIVRNNANFASNRKSINRTDVLVIDECSMISKRFFLCLDEVCKLRNPNLPFGGIQIVLAGDFTQLPPVPSVLLGDEGEFCFESELFREAFPHRVVLKEVLRQTEVELIHAIQEVSMGLISPKTVDFIKTLQRPLPPHDENVKLFSSNDKVDEYNRLKVVEFPGQLYEFKSRDEGDKGHLVKMLAPQTLWLKIGVPVILIRNITDVLVNGLRGEVSDITEDGPVISFKSVNMTVPMEKLSFSVFSPSRNMDIAVREQFPVKLAFAMTIHKSQGLTLDSVEIDCQGIFKPGQLGVAIGRARTSDGLRVINFKPQYCIPQPYTIRNFLNERSEEVLADKSCCRAKQNRLIQTEAHTGIFTVQELLSMEEDTLVEQVEIEELDFEEAIPLMTDEQFAHIDLPSDLNVHQILASLKCEPVLTPTQYNVNNILIDVDKHKYNRFCKQVYEKLLALISTLNKSGSPQSADPVPAKDLSSFYAKTHEYLNSTEFRVVCLTMFNDTAFTEDHLHICYNVSVEIRKFLLKKKAEVFPTLDRQITQRTLSAASHARVRYVGGYCVAKVRNKYMQKKKSNMYKVDEESQTIFKETVGALVILDTLRLDEQYVKATTTNPDSLVDIDRRQNIHRGLTSISDALLDFFLKLCDKCLSLFVDENLNKQGSDIFQFILNELTKDENLYLQYETTVEMAEAPIQFQEETDDPTMRKQQIRNIYKKIVKLFLMVMLNQFRKDILHSFEVTKKMAHRKQVRVQAPKSVRKQTVTISSIDDGQEPSTSGSNVAKKPTKRKEFAQDVPVPSTSGSNVEKKSKKGDEEEESEDDVICQSCGTIDKDYQWVQCDSCKKWFHRSCAGLKHHLKWKKVNKKGAKYFCVQCE